jgi:hypothetical protein
MAVTEKFNIIFPKFPLYIILADARREKFYKSEDKLPKYLQEKVNSGEYRYAAPVGNVLCAPEPIPGKTSLKAVGGKKTGIAYYRIIKNSVAAGTPRRAKISGQYLWKNIDKGRISYVQKLKDQLRAYFIPAIVRQWGPTFKLTPGLRRYIHIEYIFYMPLVLVQMDERDLSQDIGNFGWPYDKIFQDILQSEGIIATDDPSKVRGVYYRYEDIEDEEERRLEVKIHFCYNDQRIE